MDTKTNIQTKAQQLRKELEELKGKLKVEYEAGLKEMFKKHPNVESIEMHINNHEFNDGDATYFSLGYEDLTLKLKDGEELDAFYQPKNPEEMAQNDIINEFVDFFKGFDIENFYENIYSEEYESISISR